MVQLEIRYMMFLLGIPEFAFPLDLTMSDPVRLSLAVKSFHTTHDDVGC
jgi:hypothetical protein